MTIDTESSHMSGATFKTGHPGAATALPCCSATLCAWHHSFHQMTWMFFLHQPSSFNHSVNLHLKQFGFSSPQPFSSHTASTHTHQTTWVYVVLHSSPDPAIHVIPSFISWTLLTSSTQIAGLETRCSPRRGTSRRSAIRLYTAATASRAGRSIAAETRWLCEC